MTISGYVQMLQEDASVDPKTARRLQIVQEQIAKGDVIIVPHGVPHQFLEVTNPFLYYVVKVR